ncbi:Uncharacterized protein SCG7086_AA_00610 [Chlamydiales bacterium SCGC AG-110-P3]|nr:Uncharacterized protein SCG7086_AA_00610 [Chlamydiales bacterium SCGC AG-110-P3]
MSRLIDIAYARSGDKGSSANIGVIAYTEEGFQYLLKNLDEKCVAEYFRSLGPKQVTRFELPKLWSVNFVLEGILAGGGSTSLRLDNQGKALGQAILQMPVEITTKQLEVMKRGWQR